MSEYDYFRIDIGHLSFLTRGGGGHHGTVVSNNGLHQCLLLFLKIMDLDKSLKGLTKKLRGLNKQRVGSGSCKKG